MTEKRKAFLINFAYVGVLCLLAFALVKYLLPMAAPFVLGFLFAWLFALLRRGIWPALPFGMAAACLDEIIQMFVPGRGPGILDVAIDTCGVLTGILLLRIGYKLITRRQL